MKTGTGEYGEILSAAQAKRQFQEVMETMKAVAREQMNTPAGREALRRDIAALQDVPVHTVKFEGET